MLEGETVRGAVVQVVTSKRIESQNGPRYRMTLNDGKHTTSCVLLATQLNERMERNELPFYSIMEVEEVACNTVQNRKVLFLMGYTLLKNGNEVKRLLGTPEILDGTQSTTSANATEATNGHAQPRPTNSSDHAAPAPRQTNVVPVAVSHSTNGASAAAAPPNVFPLSSLTPYQNRWVVRVRITKKSAVRTFNNSRGEGKLFSVDMADETGEMRATGFGQECDKFYDFLKEGAVYYIKGGQIKSANRQFTSIVNDYELVFNSDTQIDSCFDDSVYQLPTVTFNFVKFDKLPNSPKDKVIDVIGIVESFSQCQTIMQRRTNAELKKRDVRLVDDTCNGVSVTLWGQEAENFNPEGHPVMAIKGVRLSDFNGLSLSTISGSQLHMDPDVPDAHRLKGWYVSKGHAEHMKSLTGTGGGGQSFSGNAFTPLAVAEADHLGTGDKPDYYNSKAFVTNVRKENCLYKACPAEDCNKKVVDQGTGRHRCERCNKEYDSFKWRLMLLVTISDFSGTQSVTLFNEQAEFLVGMSAQDLADLRERNEEEFTQGLEKPLFKQFTFRLRAKMETYNDEMRLKVMANRIEDVNATDYNKFLMDEIQKLE